MNWTTEQKQAFTFNGENLLVSAAAGSGKTAVLSERVAHFVEEGGDLNRLLIVTFGRAAAAEMRARIAKRLTEAAAKDPQNRHLRRQYLTLYKANICTIDSFGINLLRRNFAAADMAPDFGVLDETEQRVLESGVLDRLIEEDFHACPPGFLDFLDQFGGDQGTDGAKDAVRNLAYKAQNVPFADAWLRELANNLRSSRAWTDAACAVWLPAFREFARLSAAVRDSGVFTSPASSETAAYDADVAAAICGRLEARDWDGACAALAGWEKSSPKQEAASGDAERYKAMRHQLKAAAKTSVFTLSSARCEDDLNALRPAVEYCLELTRRFRAECLNEMRRRNSYSFGTLAELALNLTVSSYDRACGAFTRTPVAENERKAYDEIMIDEYQDVNDVQDLLFRALSRSNVFAVGDVKQSIYGFRGSNPANFLRRRKEDRPITLNKNFRSAPGVLDAVNFIFRGLFSEEFGGMEYDKDEQLNHGRTEQDQYPFPAGYDDLLEAFADDAVPFHPFPEGQSPVSEVFLLRNNAFNADAPDVNRDEAQALVCAKLIRDAVDGGATVYDKDGKTARPMRYSDISVLLRTNKPLDIYMDVFRRCGIPLVSARESFLTQPETYGLLALLSALNDPRDDFYFFLALTGSAFRLTSEQVARFRLAAKGQSLYDGMEAAAADDPVAAQTLTQWNRFRVLADNLPPARLIWEIYSATDYIAAETAYDPVARDRLMRFYTFACRYSGADGLGGFLAFARRAQEGKRGGDGAGAPEGNYVTLQTVHVSKGLEYPWCIACQAENIPNNGRVDNVILDGQLGVGLQRTDMDNLLRYDTLPREVIRLRTAKNEAAERLRVWYVALTRARDRLTVIGETGKDVNKKTGEYAPEYAVNCDEKGRMTYTKQLTEKKFSVALLSRLSLHPDVPFLQDALIRPESAAPVRVTVVKVPRVEPRALQTEEKRCGLSADELSRRFSFRYDGHLAAVPAKVSVTEIAKSPADPDSALLIETPPAARPRFLDGDRLTATEAGTATHAYCQFADLFAPVENEIARLTAEGHLTPQEAEALRVEDLKKLQASPLIGLLKTAVGYRREVRFVCRIPVSYFSGKPGEEGQMLMQGAIDLLIETPEGYRIVDFKTDRATEEELLERYSRQINLYVTAVEQLYDKPVLGASLWAFRLGKEIPVQRGDL